MIRKYRTEDTDALIPIQDKAEPPAHPFLPCEARDQVRKDLRNWYLANAKNLGVGMQRRPGWLYRDDGKRNWRVVLQAYWISEDRRGRFWCDR